jgi:hypothetical protein
VTDTPRAVPGDAVRLTADYRLGDRDLRRGQIGVVQTGRHPLPPPGWCLIAFNHHTFRGRPYPGAPERATSTGDYHLIEAHQLVATGERVALDVWHWADDVAQVGGGLPYTVQVALWDWTPTGTTEPDPAARPAPVPPPQP